MTLASLDAHATASPILSAATGSGKSLMVSALADALIQRDKRAGRVLVVTHRAELVMQNHAKLPKHLRGSIYSASVGKKDLSGDVIFANVQSVQKQWHKLPKLQAMIIDECHYAAKSYYDLIENVRQPSPDMRVIGMTATPYNGAGVWLHMLPKHRIFSGISTEVGIVELLDRGFLSPLVPYRTEVRINANGLEIDARTGDFRIADVQALVGVPELVINCAAEIRDVFKSRNSVLVFCSGAQHTKDMAAALGSDAAFILDDTPKLKRAALIEKFRRGELKYLCACEVLLVGFDAPCTDGIACVRPSRSPLVWVQLLGRGMRLFETKPDCLVADFCGNADHFGPVNEIEGRPPRNTSGEAPTRVCDGCFNIILAALKVCPHCGHEYAHEARQQHLDPNTGLLVSGMVKNDDGTKTYPVERVEFISVLTSKGAPALVAHYFAPNRLSPVAIEYYNMWHRSESVARRDGARWLKRLTVPGGIPTSVEEALARASFGALRVPKNVTVNAAGEFPLRFNT